MDLNRVKYLLDKFYAGETTSEEENHLMTFFKNEEVPVELLADKETFIVMSELDDESKPTKEFSNKLEDLIDNKLDEGKVILFNKTTRWVIGIAASVLLLISVYVTQNISSQSWKKDTYSDPEMAYEETLRVLNFVSETMNRNTTTLSYIKTVNSSIKPVKFDYLKRKENETNKYNEINTDNDLFINSISAKWPGIAGR